MLKIVKLFISFFLVFDCFSATTNIHIRPWPNSTFYYIMDGGYSEEVESRIRDAIHEIASLNIVRFVELKDPKKFPESGWSIFTYSDWGCSSHVGWNTDEKRVNSSGGGLIRIADGCSKGVIMHEILHALGFHHEHVNPTSNLIFNFDRVLHSMDQLVNEDASALTEFDPDSIMNYSSNALSVCHSENPLKRVGLPLEKLPHRSCWGNIEVIVPLKNGGDLHCPAECAVFIHPIHGLIEGQREYLSPLDIEGLRKLYPVPAM